MALRRRPPPRQRRRTCGRDGCGSERPHWQPCCRPSAPAVRWTPPCALRCGRWTRRTPFGCGSAPAPAWWMGCSPPPRYACAASARSSLSAGETSGTLGVQNGGQRGAASSTLVVRAADAEPQPQPEDVPPPGTPEDLARLDGYWGGLWAEPVEDPLPPEWLAPLRRLRPMPAPPAIRPDRLRAAARRVGLRKAAGADDWAYGHVAAWPEPLLCDCLSLAERPGRWPSTFGPSSASCLRAGLAGRVTDGRPSSCRRCIGCRQRSALWR